MPVDTPANPSQSYTASTSLLRRVRLRDQDAWRRLVRIYGPLLYRWSRKAGLQPTDAEDIVNSVFVDVIGSVDRFVRDDREHSFRRWLSTICYHRVLKYHKKANAQPAAEGGSALSLRLAHFVTVSDPADEAADRDEIRWLRQRVATVLQAEFSEQQWEIFRRTVLQEEPPAEVAKSLSVTVWAVYKTRSRILLRLKQELPPS